MLTSVTVIKRAGHAPTLNTRKDINMKVIFDKQLNTLDEVKRSDFESDEAYLHACTLKELEKSSPEYQRIHSRLARELEARKEKERNEAINAAFEERRKSVKLDAYDLERIDNEAREAARREYASGAISYNGLASATERHAAQLTQAAKDAKAHNAVMNALFRGEI